jgi:hypothetical protein
VHEYADVPPEILARLRPVCLGLPEAYEEQAWAGRRWRIRKKTFAHVITIESGWPPAYAHAMRTGPADGPVTAMTFRSSGAELDALVNSGHPFYKPDWSPTVVGIVLDAGTDWDEVAELLTESYCIMAPQKLVGLLNRPSG